MAIESEQQSATATSRVEFVGFWYRLGSILWDALILAGLITAVLAAVAGDELGKEHSQSLVALLTVELAIGYFLVSWILFGRSPGKWCCSQRIVAFGSGRRPPAWRCALRLLCWPTVLLPGWVVMLRDPYRRALHDKLAGTCVIADDSMRTLQDEELAEAGKSLRPPPWRAQTR